MTAMTVQDRPHPTPIQASKEAKLRSDNLTQRFVCSEKKHKNLSFCTPKFFRPKSFLVKSYSILVEFTDNIKDTSKLNF